MVGVYDFAFMWFAAFISSVSPKVARSTSMFATRWQISILSNMDIFLLIISSALIGLIVGALSGLLGIGGGTILVAIFKLAYGLPATVSTATSLFTIIPTSFSGALTHFKKKTCIPALGIAAGLGGACTSPVGVWLASISPDWLIMVAAAIVIAYSAITMFSKAMKLRKAQKLQVAQEADHCDLVNPAKQQSAESLVAVETLARCENHSNAETAIAQSDDSSLALNIPLKKLAGFGIGVGALAGVMSGYIGVGGGFLMVPLFMQLLKTPMKLTSGTSLIAVMILAIPGTITNAAMGNIDWIAGIFVAIGAIPGAILGSRLISKVPEFQLRLLFSAFLIVVAIMLVIDQLGIL